MTTFSVPNDHHSSSNSRILRFTCLRSSTQCWVAILWMLQSAEVLPSFSCLPRNMTHCLSRGHVQQHSKRTLAPLPIALYPNGFKNRPRRQRGNLKTPFWLWAVAAFSITTTNHWHKGQSIQNASMAMAPQGQTAANSARHSASMPQERKRAR